MDYTLLKTADHNFWADLEYIGQCAAGLRVSNKKMLFGGKNTVQLDDTLFTGRVMLLVNQGGLRNKSVSEKAKALFKQDVLPKLSSHTSEISRQHTGKMMLHFREGLLTTFNLTQ